MRRKVDQRCNGAWDFLGIAVALLIKRAQREQNRRIQRGGWVKQNSANQQPVSSELASHLVLNMLVRGCKVRLYQRILVRVNDAQVLLGNV